MMAHDQNSKLACRLHKLKNQNLRMDMSTQKQHEATGSTRSFSSKFEGKLCHLVPRPPLLSVQYVQNSDLRGSRLEQFLSPRLEQFGSTEDLTV